MATRRRGGHSVWVQEPTTPYWSTDAYADQLRLWVEDLVGPVQMTRRKLRAWSTVWKVRAADGVYWAKQNCPSQAFEGELTAHMATWIPDRVLEPVAVREDGVFLLPDGGPVLRDVDGGPADLEAWRHVVGEWALLQRDLLAHTDEMTALGVDTVRSEDAVSFVRDRADLLHALDPADARHLDEPRWRAVHASLPAVEDAAEALVALGLPLALNHNDLHDGNAFVAAPGRPLRFFDLADSVLTDPTAALLVPLVMLPDDPRAAGTVAAAWVEVWREVVDEAALWRALPHGLRLARLSRHVAWWRVMTAMTDEELAEWGVAASYWLAKVADPPPDLVRLIDGRRAE
jgi:hypothetical protein